MARSLCVFQKKLILLGGIAQVSRLLSMYKNVLKKTAFKNVFRDPNEQHNLHSESLFELK